MKLRVILADDEPSALRSLQYAIETYLSNFQIVYSAENGMEALEKVKVMQPDILITDIKMPLLSGIGLVEKVQQFSPTTYAVVITGYQDFEYAKNAIRLGVVDYLLKPLDIEQLSLVLEKLRARKLIEIYHKQVTIINRSIQGVNPNSLIKKEVARYLPNNKYLSALVRMNGFPSRFSTNNLIPWIKVDKRKESLIDLRQYEGVWLIDGRDALEFFVFRMQNSNAPPLKEVIHSLLGYYSYNYYTIVFINEPFELCESHNISRILYQTLDNRVVLGLNQTFWLSKKEPDILQYSSSLNNSFEKKIAFLVLNTMYKDLKQEIRSMFERWESERRPQLWVENDIRQLFDIILRRIYIKVEAQSEIGILLNEAFSLSTTFKELFDHIWKIVEKATCSHKDMDQKIDTKDFFNQIQEYIQQNLGEPLSLESVCSHIGISQTYLSRLFKKYINMSFNKYITMLRIEEAKKLMIAIPNITVQDVAYTVGYEIPSYFSKVFREVVGMTPSEYMTKNK